MEYEGDYINNKYNGKGYDKNNNINYEVKGGKGLIKDYGFFGDLIFEGEYLNGLINGKVKEYWNGKLLFEGEYLNGLRHGKGKEYDYDDYDGQLIFEGEYLNGLKNGKGKEYRDDKLIYEGEYLNGKRLKGEEFDYFWWFNIQDQYLKGKKLS